MVLGEYPCCGAPLMLTVPDGGLPVYASESCEQCGKTVWHKFSRIEPQSWTEEDFLKEHDVDKEAKTVKLKESPRP